jgi:hypothetical protein
MSTDQDTDDLADDVGGVDDPEGSKTYSYVYLTALFAAIVAALAASVYFGFVTPDVEVNATLSIGWILEYTVAGIVALFFLWTFAQVANIVGMNFIGGVVGVIARIAHNYELPNPPGDTEDEGEGDE